MGLLYLYLYRQWARIAQSVQTGYGPEGPGIEFRWGGFSAHVQIDPEVHPASYTVSTRSFPGAKRPGSDDNYLPRSSASLPPSVPPWQVIWSNLRLLWLPSSK